MAELTPERLREIESSALEGSNERCIDHATVPILDGDGEATTKDIHDAIRKWELEG